MILVNNEPIESFKFSGGEMHVKDIPTYPSPDGLSQGRSFINVFAFIRSSDDVMRLFLTLSAIKYKSTHPIILQLPYVPYGRQDRICNMGEAFSLKVFAEILNSFNIQSVEITDAHSDVSTALINNSYSLPYDDFWENKMPFYKDGRIENHIIVSPDTGAYKKISKAFPDAEIIVARKVRDTSNGRITKVMIDQKIEPKSYIIIDDICDGGATFIALAKKLKELGAIEVILYVTFGIFAKGFDELKKYVDKIYCFYTFNPIPEQHKDYVCLGEKDEY